MYILSLYFGKKRILEAKTRWRSCEAEELNGRREEVTGCLEMNDFEINFLDTQAAVTGGRGMKLTLSCRGGPWIMEDVLSKFLKCTTIAYWLPRKGGYNIYTRLLSTNQLFQHWHFGMAIYELSSRSFHAFVFSIRLRRRWIDSLESFGGGKEIDFYRFIWIIWINRIFLHEILHSSILPNIDQNSSIFKRDTTSWT